MQPRRTPSSAPNGISSAWAPAKPTTSQGIGLPLPVSIDHPRPDRHGVDRPGHLDHQPAHADNPAVDLDPVEFRDLFGKGFHEPWLRYLELSKD